MKRFIPGMPSPAMGVAILALIVALGGISYAATKLPKNSVGAKQLKKNAVRSTQVKNKSLKAIDFKPGQLPAGPQGQQGVQGAQGDTGPPGLSGYQQVQATATTSSSTSKFAIASCPPGLVVLGGGAAVTSGEGQAFIDESFPSSDDEFYAETRTTGGAVAHGIRVYAICAAVAP